MECLYRLHRFDSHTNGTGKIYQYYRDDKNSAGNYILNQLTYKFLCEELIKAISPNITAAPYLARWRLKAQGSRLFTQRFIQAQVKENIKTPRHWPLWGEFTSDQFSRDETWISVKDDPNGSQ